MIDIIDKIPSWQAIRRLLLEEKKSLLIHTPRFYGDDEFIHSLIASSRHGDFDILRINADEHVYRENLNYKSVWESTKTQLGLDIEMRVDVEMEADIEKKADTGMDMQTLYYKTIEDIIFNLSKDLLIVLFGGGRGKEKYQFQLVTLFHNLYSKLPPEKVRKVTILVLDDYSLYYYKRGEGEETLRSPWFLFSRKHIGAISSEQIKDCILQLQEGANNMNTETVNFYVNEIKKLSGYHTGIVMELLKYLRDKNWSITKDEWKIRKKGILNNSQILESLRNTLIENQEGFSKKALEFSKPKFLSDKSGPTVRILLHLGILQKKSPLTAVLCGGVIKEMINKLYEASSKPESFGVVYSDLGPRTYQKEELTPEDDDIVIAHISDLHIGKDCPFQLPNMKTEDNEHKRPIVEIFKNDLEKLKLIGRLDGLIISGDISNAAEIDEFTKAKELLEEISRKIELPLDKFTIIAGNHDLQWTPGSLASTHLTTGISRDNFEIFRVLLKKPTEHLVELSTIKSKNKKRILRILSMDSNLVESPKAAGIGYVGPDVLVKAKEFINQSNIAKEVEVESIYTWIVIHHHVFPVSSTPAKDAYVGGLSAMGNVTDLLSFANEDKVEMILHGHGHQPCITVSRRWPLENEAGFGRVISVGAGSFSGHNSIIAPFSKNHYFLIYRRLEHTIIRSRTLANGLTFDTHSDLIIPHQNTSK